MRIIYIVLEYITWWFPILCFSLPVIQTIIYYAWYVDYKKRKEEARWQRIEAFFTKNVNKYPDAAVSFKKARFWASPKGYDLMHKIKTIEYEELKNEH